MKNKIILMKTLMIFCWILCRLNLPETLGKFASEVTSDVRGNIAFYVIDSNYQSLEINLDKIVPSETPYEYDFSIANYNEDKRLETNAEYHIVIRATTNLNLEFELYENENTESAIISKELVQDIDGTYYLLMKTATEYFGFTENQINNYTLSVKFPIEYKSFTYQDNIDSLEVIILSSQVVD